MTRIVFTSLFASSFGRSLWSSYLLSGCPEEAA
jgi:hypothetical protein